MATMPLPKYAKLTSDISTDTWLIVTMGYYVSAEALAAAKSVEGRQQGDDITRRCSACVGHRIGVIERPNERFWWIQGQ